ncbi:MAG TPA: hypothetical protein VH186_38735 [Chloroflexia bacterium]|nr:hypothetical protein [Chloroflexia bacterium]
MPRKKESNTGILPGFNIFDQPLPENDRGVLVKTPYRRKQLAGFVPLWNEFFRCYHYAGVSPNAVYLWAYLRQYEHERREWNAISDISWPGRRDLADSLGVSIAHLPYLLEELRKAGLVSFQPVLPGFAELAGSLDLTIEVVRDRAAEYGVNPKVDGTLYRTADPFTKTEFASATRLKFCKGCKIYRYCEGAREAQNRQEAENEKPSALAAKAKKAVLPEKTPLSLSAPEYSRQLNPVKNTGFNPEMPVLTPVESDRTQEETVAVSKKERPVTLNRIGGRIKAESESVSKKEQPVTLSRIKTNKDKPVHSNQPEINTTMQPIDQTTKPKTNPVLVVENKLDKSNLVGLDDIAGAKPSANQELLVQFGFDTQTARKLCQYLEAYNKPEDYLPRILRYARENARQNPQGMVRRLIERGEDRLSRADRWQQQSLFEQTVTIEEEIGEVGVSGESTEVAVIEDITYPLQQPQAVNRTVEINTLWQQVARVYALTQQDFAWWEAVLGQLEKSGYSGAASLFRHGMGVREKQGRLLVILRNLFDQRRAAVYNDQLERAVAATTGQLPAIDYISFS